MRVNCADYIVTVHRATLKRFLFLGLDLANLLDRSRQEGALLSKLQLLFRRYGKTFHAAFQLLNLKNDTLRKRSDSIKYNMSNILAW